VAKACHALALDDHRASFHPLLWDEPVNPAGNLAPREFTTDSERLTQVFFAGAHADVGGGYPDDSLSAIPFLWMVAEAEKRGARFLPHFVDQARAIASPHGKLHDSRSELGSFYTYKPRWLLSYRDRAGAQIHELKIHSSVQRRLSAVAQAVQ